MERAQIETQDSYDRVAEEYARQFWHEGESVFPFLPVVKSAA